MCRWWGGHSRAMGRESRRDRQTFHGILQFEVVGLVQCCLEVLERIKKINRSSKIKNMGSYLQ